MPSRSKYNGKYIWNEDCSCGRKFRVYARAVGPRAAFALGGAPHAEDVIYIVHGVWVCPCGEAHSISE